MTPKRNKLKPKKMDEVKCYNCSDYSHMSYDYPEANKKKSFGKGKSEKKEESKEEEDKEEKPKKKSNKKVFDKSSSPRSRSQILELK